MQLFCCLAQQELNVSYKTSIISINVHIAQTLTRTIIMKKRN